MDNEKDTNIVGMNVRSHPKSKENKSKQKSSRSGNSKSDKQETKNQRHHILSSSLGLDPNKDYNKCDIIRFNNLLVVEHNRLKLKELALTVQEQKLRSKIGKIKANKSWNAQLEQMAKDLGEEAAAYKWMHEKSGRNCYKLGLAFTIIEMIIGTLVGGGVMGTVSNYLNQLWFKILCGVIVWLVAVMTGIQENLNYNGKSIEHRKASSNFSSLYHSIKEELSKYRRKRQDAHSFIKSNTLLYDSLVSAGPEISDRVMKEYLSTTRGSNIAVPIVVGDQIHEIEIKHDESVSDKENNSTSFNDSIFRFRSSNLMPGKLMPGTIKKSPSYRRSSILINRRPTVSRSITPSHDSDQNIEKKNITSGSDSHNNSESQLSVDNNTIQSVMFPTQRETDPDDVSSESELFSDDEVLINVQAYEDKRMQYEIDRFLENDT